MISGRPRGTSHSRRAAPARAGFTLIELMIVVSIIALLAALITPAVQAAFLRAKIARVSSEITGLDQGIAQFKAKFHHNPPSFVILSEAKKSDGGWTDAGSRDTMIKLFGPSFDFEVERDFDGDGNRTPENPTGNTTFKTFVLTGDECLVFFLGGMPAKDGSGKFTLTGFSQSKINPFKRGGTNRLQFYNDWVFNRLSDRDSDGMPEYYDEFNDPAKGYTTPYLYLSTMRTSTYQVWPDLDKDGDTSTTSDPLIASFYYQSSNAQQSAWRKGSFQIISPGEDHNYGNGGHWKQGDSSSLANADLDNQTNFSGGVLQQ